MNEEILPPIGIPHNELTVYGREAHDEFLQSGDVNYDLHNFETGIVQGGVIHKRIVTAVSKYMPGWAFESLELQYTFQAPTNYGDTHHISLMRIRSDIKSERIDITVKNQFNETVFKNIGVLVESGRILRLRDIHIRRRLRAPK